MTVATRLVRVDVQETILTGMQIRCPDLRTELTYPGADWANNTMYLLVPTGNIDTPLCMAGEKIRDDDWVQPVVFVSGVAGKNKLESGRRCLGWLDELCEIVYEDLQLGETIPGLELCEVGAYDGPDPARNGEGFQTFLRVDLHCVARIHPST